MEKPDRPLVRRSFSRRRFFGGLGGAALIAQPLFRAHFAHAAAQPKVIIFYVGGGLSSHTWRQDLPHGTALAGSALKGGLDVFEQSEFRALKPYLTVLDGVSLKWATKGTSMFNAHGASAQASMVASFSATGVSLDRYLGSKLGGGLFPSVRLKVIRGRWDHSSPSSGGSGSLSKSFGTPGEAYDGLFGRPTAGAATPTAAAPDLRLRRDVLDHSLSECKLVVAEVERQLGAAAAQRVVSHCDSLRDLQRRADALLAEGASTVKAACAPARPEAAGAADFVTLPQTMDMFQRVAANALACGRTRVVLYELWTDQPDDKMGFLKGCESMSIHPQIFHAIGGNFGPGAPAIRDAQIAYARFLFGKLAALMKSAADLGLLEDTLILWATNEVNGGHGYSGVAPCLYAGKGGGRFVAGKYLSAKGATTTATTSVGINDVLTSVLRGVGIDDARFGDDNSGRARYGADELMLV